MSAYDGYGSDDYQHRPPSSRSRRRSSDWNRSDVAGSHALIDRDFDEDDVSWKDDLDDLSPAMGF